MNESASQDSRESASPPDPADPSPAAFPRRVALIVAAAFFMEMLDGTIVTTALPAIAQSLGESTLALTACITAYLVAMAVFVPSAGWASDRFDARNLFAAAVAVFTIASLLCGISPTFWTLIASRLLQGAAAAFMSPVGRLIVLRETATHQIIDAIGWIVWPALIAPVVGPPLGGFITTYASWHWIFLINVPLGIAGVILVLKFVPRRPTATRTKFDLAGFVLTGAALATLIHGLSLVAQGGASTSLGSALIAFGLGCGYVAIRHALKRDAPMLDLAAARIPTFALTTVTAGFVARIAISMTPFLLPLMFQIGFGESAFASGLMLLVYMGGNLAMKSVTTPVLRRFGFRDVVRVNGILCAASLAACGFLSPGLAMPVICVVLFVAGMTRSMHFTSMATLAFADVDAARRPGATTLAAMAQQVAGAVGVAVAALALGFFQASRGGEQLALGDFQRALFAASALMAVAIVWSQRLPRSAGAGLRKKE